MCTFLVHELFLLSGHVECYSCGLCGVGQLGAGCGLFLDLARQVQRLHVKKSSFLFSAICVHFLFSTTIGLNCTSFRFDLILEIISTFEAFSFKKTKL